MNFIPGKYYAASVQDEDASFEIEMAPDGSSEGFTGQRSSIILTDELNEIDAVKATVKEGIDKIKKGGWKSAFGIAQKIINDSLMDEREKRDIENAKAYKDPMDPTNAFALIDTDKIKYESIYLLKNKDKNAEGFQFRTNNCYGVLQQIEDGLWREISFSFPSAEYAEKHFPLEAPLGVKTFNWRREDDRLHKMRVHYLSLDKKTSEAAANNSSLEKVKEEWFEIDHTSSRDQEPVRFSEPDFLINAKTGEITLYHVYAWFLPRLTTSGRQIQYNWDALRITVTHKNKLIKRFISWTAEVGSESIRSQRTSMALANGGYIGELDPGDYKLSIAIYDDVVFDYPFEVVRTESSDKRNPYSHCFSIKTPRDDYANVTLNNESWDLDIYYPAVRLLEKCNSEDTFELSLNAVKNGKIWHGYEWDENEKGGLIYGITVRDNPSWANKRFKLSIPVGSHSTFHERKLAVTGELHLPIYVNGDQVDQLTVNITDSGEIVAQEVAINQPLADIDFPEEHGGDLIKL